MVIIIFAPLLSPADEGSSASLEQLLFKARQTRGVNFPPAVEYVYPRLTLAVRTTAITCPLNCAHCGGHYLRGMVSVTKALIQQQKNRYKSFLVSGACNAQGRVPHREKWPEICALAARGELNIHSGLVGEEEAAELGKVARTISFDFVTDAETIREVYGLHASPEDYLRSYRLLRKRCRVVPHICLGLMGGRIKGEYRALEVLKEEGVEAISFIVFRPTPGTALGHCPPPLLEEVARVLAFARVTFPNTPLYLGCLRPGGQYRQQLDCLALHAGINKIVQPAPAARRLAEKLELAVHRGEECCAL
ncbi:MAG: radical SAM protein [Bacillota bacterium]